MMSSLNLPTLEERRNKSKITTMYKIINGNLSIPTNDLIPNHRPSREGYYNPPFVIHSPTLDEFCTNLNMHYDHTCQAVHNNLFDFCTVTK